MRHKSAAHVLTLVGQEAIPFEEIFAVQDAAVISKGAKIMDKLQPAADPVTGQFDLATAVEIVKADPALAILQVTTRHISGNNTTVQNVVNGLRLEVDDLIGLALPQVTQDELQKTITCMFIDLKSQEDDEWFRLVSSKDSTTYHYNAAFIVQNELTGWLFYVLPVALTVTLNVDKQALFALQLNDKVDYSLEIGSLKIGAQLNESRSGHSGGYHGAFN